MESGLASGPTVICAGTWEDKNHITAAFEDMIGLGPVLSKQQFWFVNKKLQIDFVSFQAFVNPGILFSLIVCS